jgi:hypothetical protein
MDFYKKLKLKKTYMLERRLFFVVLYRWGDDNNHSYPVGAFDTEAEAVIVAEWAISQRGGKYDAEIYETFVNEEIHKYRTIRADDVNPDEAENAFTKFYEHKD